MTDVDESEVELSEAKQIYEALNDLFIGKPTDDILTAVGLCLVDIFTDDLFPENGEEETDREFLSYSIWLKRMYEIGKPINKSGVIH